MSSQLSSDIYFQAPFLIDHDDINDNSDHYFCHLPLYMTRNELEGFCLCQNSTINEQNATIRGYQAELEAAEVANVSGMALFEELGTAIIRKDSELLEAQRTLRATGEVISACRNNMRNLGLLLDDKDQLIASLSTRLAELSTQVEQSSYGSRLPSALPLRGSRAREDSPTAPFPQTPSPAPSQSASAGDRPTGVPAAIGKRRDRKYSAPIETPREAERNGRPTHRRKRARHDAEGHLEGETVQASSPSTGS